MFINFGNSEKVLFEIKIGNQVIERQEVAAPKEMLIAMFMNYVQQMAGNPQHMHLRMSGEEVIWDNFENKQKVIPKYIDYWNWDYQDE